MAAISRHTWNVKISLWAAFVETLEPENVKPGPYETLKPETFALYFQYDKSDPGSVPLSPNKIFPAESVGCRQNVTFWALDKLFPKRKFHGPRVKTGARGCPILSLRFAPAKRTAKGGNNVD